MTVANLLGILHSLVRADWQPLSVLLARRPPADVTEFRQVFGPGVRFNQPFDAVVFRSRDLDLPTVTADPALRAYTRRLLETVTAPVRAPYPATAAARVRSVVEVLLPAGRCSLGHVSRALHVPPRSLHRHLVEEGENFTAIVNDIRARWAERYLANESYSLTQIAQLLGFAAPSAFSVWFRGHFGITATEWRRRTRPDSVASPSAQEQVGDLG
jgi:AraC-like DNA-binding protein